MIRYQVSDSKKTLFPEGDSSPLARLQERGPGALTTGELLSLLITPTQGKKGADAATLAELVLARFGGLAEMGAAEAHELVNLPGLGIHNGGRIAAALELARRFQDQAGRAGQSLAGAEEAYQFLKPRLRDQPREVFAAIMLDQKHRIIAYRELFYGTICASAVHPREIVKAVLRDNAAALLIAHNHPSGHVSPSPDDLRLTEDLKTLLSHLDVRLIDHIIVGANGYFSFAREGLMR